MPAATATARIRPTSVTLARLRASAATRTLFTPTTLPAALRRLGFVQADPIRAPARAQDLILRHRVRGYRDGDLERRYARLPVEEDALHNYGFLTRELQALMHPRTLKRKTRIERSHPELIEPILEFVRTKGATHPRDLDAHHGGRSVTNYWGGSSSAATHVLDTLHYRGALRVTHRENGIRVYAVATHHGSPSTDGTPLLSEEERVGRLLAHLVRLYAPLPASSLRQLAMMLRYGAPHLEPWLRDRNVLRNAEAAGRIARIELDDGDWYVPPGERVDGAPGDAVRLLAPFDPIVWDRRRFEILWGWRYRFEAYTPPAKRVLGYYALPLLWRDAVIGWANVRAEDRRIAAEIGFAGKRPASATFRRELALEFERMRDFLGAEKVGRIALAR
jgi:uncharacterized protein YcaQ